MCEGRVVRAVVVLSEVGEHVGEPQSQETEAPRGPRYPGIPLAPEAAAPPVQVTDERGGDLNHRSVQWQIVRRALDRSNGVEGDGAA